MQKQKMFLHIFHWKKKWRVVSGQCLACVCKTNEVDSHSMVKNKRICKDGPVFDVKEVDFS